MPKAVFGSVSAMETGIQSIRMKVFFLSNYFFLRLIAQKLADSCRAGRFCDVIMTAENCPVIQEECLMALVPVTTVMEELQSLKAELRDSL